MNPESIQQEKEKLILFTKVGVVVLTSLLLLATSIHFYPQTAATLNQKLKVGASAKELPIYCVDKGEEKKISLSFDAAWGNEDTGQILDVLKKNDVRVTFFMTGGWIEKYPEDVKAIAADGHDLGNHSENHKQMSRLSAEQCKEEILKPHEKVKQLTGKEMILFRPPYGDYNDNLIQVCREIKYYPIQWDVDSLDWKDYDADTIVRRVTQHKHLGNGSIILCHNGAKHTAEALDTMIKTLKEKGFELVPISELIWKDHYEMDTEGRQHTTG
ncbi:MAG: polysaccharide deacetylase family protein [Eubacterium sp.]|nr:polysaccharide deacetylase family protein [Eubacterium sp.]